jgi:hypothetical protein
VLLVPLEPASDHGHQDLQDHERSSDWKQRRHRMGQYTTSLRNFSSVETADLFNYSQSRRMGAIIFQVTGCGTFHM